MTTTLSIDGSQGEGGGQIIRSSLALAMVTGRSVMLNNIRAGRTKPGLKRQHLTAVKAAAEVCGGEVHGAELRSLSLQFEPGPVQGGTYQFSVGTAGSATLVLQTVLPALLVAAEPSTLTLEGGTHNPWAPPFDFLQRTFLPLVNRMGPRVSATLDRHGFYPAGGGRFTVEIEPVNKLAGFDLLERGRVESRAATAVVSNLPLHIAEREVDTVLRKLHWNRKEGSAAEVVSNGPGNAVFAEIQSKHVTELFVDFGSKGVPAERVARNVAKEAIEYLNSDVPVGRHLADQLMLPLGISAWQPANGPRQRGGSFRTLSLTEHSRTQIEILRTFLGIAIDIEESGKRKPSLVRIAPQ